MRVSDPLLTSESLTGMPMACSLFEMTSQNLFEPLSILSSSSPAEQRLPLAESSMMGGLSVLRTMLTWTVLRFI